MERWIPFASTLNAVNRSVGLIDPAAMEATRIPFNKLPFDGTVAIGLLEGVSGQAR